MKLSEVVESFRFPTDLLVEEMEEKVLTLQALCRGGSTTEEWAALDLGSSLGQSSDCFDIDIDYQQRAGEGRCDDMNCWPVGLVIDWRG